MRISISSLLFILIFCIGTFGQALTREEKLRNIDELINQIKSLEKDVLLPDTKDLKQAAKQGFEVFRLLPREKYDGKLSVRGGAAYYSFTDRTHEYGRAVDIELAKSEISVGFAGADYGMIYDLGATPLESVTEKTSETAFLINYKPPTDERSARAEHLKIRNKINVNGFTYDDRAPVVVGNTYLLRSINFDQTDVLVALHIDRKDADGSLIIFWKMIKQFEKPILNGE